MRQIEEDKQREHGKDDGLPIDDCDGDEEGDIGGFDLDPMDLANRDLARHIRDVTPGYEWCAHAVDGLEEIRIPDPPHEVQLRRTGKAFIQGRGEVHVAHADPPSYMEPIRWRWNQLKWTTAPGEAVPNEPAWTSSFLECVIDLELSTGFRIGADGAAPTSWAEKARILAYTIRAAARIYGLVKGTTNITLKQAVSPRTDSPSLTLLGAPLVSGFGRRPIWLSSRTPEVVACNVWRARRAERQATEQQDRTCRGRLFARGWEIDYRGYPAEDRWTSEAEKRLKQKAAEEKKKRQMMAGLANNPHAKKVKDIICDLCWPRFAQLPDPSHDAAQGGPMMLCLKCYGEKGRDRGHRQDKRDSSSTSAMAPSTVSTATHSSAKGAPATTIVSTTSLPTCDTDYLFGRPHHGGVVGNRRPDLEQRPMRT